MVPRPLAPARPMKSRTCADVIQPCPLKIEKAWYNSLGCPRKLNPRHMLQGTSQPSFAFKLN